MSTRRAPLADVPNGINSPFRGGPTTNTASIKRTRAQAGDQREVVLGQPPYKKQVIELVDNDTENVDPRKRSAVAVVGHDKQDELFTRRRTNAPPTEFTQRLTAVARERRTVPVQQQQQQQQNQSRAEQPQKNAGDNNLESIRLWQRHYRRQFPSFVFYFESVPEDARLRSAAQFRSLGARELRFFSKEVTHVITTRPIPPESAANAAEEDNKADTAEPKTIRPSALTQDQRRTTDLLDANLQRRSQNYATAGVQDVHPRRLQPQSRDVLCSARSMKIKIWALEKLQRVLKTMLETDAFDESAHTDVREHGSIARATMKAGKDADLEQLLRNEKVNGPADRDMTVAAQDMVPFKGCYIYIHDMDERTKPVMVRDYPKPQTKEQGQWPQFRLTPAGRCPFLEDSTNTKKAQQTHDTQNAKAEQELAAQRKTRAAAEQHQPRPLAEREANLRRSPRKAVQLARTELSKPLEPPKMIPTKRQSSMDGMPHLFGSAQQSIRGLPRMIGGEPVASGLQQSNVTSAIRSQVISSAAISSTAAGIPKRVGDTKEVSALKRKVLERGANVTSLHSMPSSYMNDVRAAINEQNDPPPRAAKRRAQETLGVVEEDDEDGQDSRSGRRSMAKRRKPAPKEAKPGYCENCRDKFEDFDEHVNSRKHRKFALTKDNWFELDELLSHLKRPHKVA